MPLPLHLADGFLRGAPGRPSLVFGGEAQRKEFQAWKGYVDTRLGARFSSKERSDLIDAVWYESKRAGLEPSLVLALAEQVSEFRLRHIGSDGAVGLLQIGSDTRDRFSLVQIDPLFDPRVNLRIGLTVLRHFLDSNNGNLMFALQAYRYQTAPKSKEPTEAVTKLFAEQVLSAKRQWSPGQAPVVLAKLAEPPVQKLARGAQVTTSSSQAARPQLNPEQDPAFTGHLPGQAQLAQGGLSTFTVDNRSSASDATVRLYRGDRRPAVRSIFVRRGETFTMRDLSPGTYTLRYRFSDRPGTFKADETFRLYEEETAQGTRYSVMRVTLYTVQNGNMSTHPVPDGDF